MKKIVLTVVAAAFSVSSALAAGTSAQKDTTSAHRDPYGYYSQYDKIGYYDREGNYVRFVDNKRYSPPDTDDDDNYAPPPPQISDNQYLEQCRRSRESANTAGTLFGALAGGLIGGAASSGRHHGASPGAVIGGIILGGMVGNALTRDMPCEDHPYAMRAYADGLNGPVGTRRNWRYQDDYGYFVPEREFVRRGYTCRSYTETTFIRGRKYTNSGTACRTDDGNWRFDD